MIVLRTGPAGPRPGLVGGPDVWEVARLFTGVAAGDEEALRRVADDMALTMEQVRAAHQYYLQFPDEIDSWIQSVDDEVARAEAAWRRERRLE